MRRRHAAVTRGSAFILSPQKPNFRVHSAVRHYRSNTHQVTEWMESEKEIAPKMLPYSAHSARPRRTLRMRSS